MAKAKKLPSGNWRVQVLERTECVNGVTKKIRKSFTAPTKKEAELKAAEWQLSHADVPVSLKTFKQAFDEYTESKSNILSPSTIRGYNTAYKNGLAPQLATKTLSEIASGNLLQKVLNSNAVKHSTKYLKNQYGVVTAVLRANGLTAPAVTFPVAAKKEMALPNKTQCLKIIEALKDAPLWLECQILLALTCSLRVSEIFALTPSKIKDGKVCVRGAVVRGPDGDNVYKAANKTKHSARDVVMPTYLAERMAELCKGHGDDERLFTHPEQVCLLQFKRLLVAHGLPEFSIHAMRHAYAAWMTSQNVPESKILADGGWEPGNGSVMKRVYRYAFDEDQARVKAAADSFFVTGSHESTHNTAQAPANTTL